MMNFASYNHWVEVAGALDVTLSQVVRKVAFDVQGVAQAAAPVDTGFLKNSIYVVTSKESTYGQAGTPPGDSYLLPEVAPPSDNHTAYIGVGANYAQFVEYGTRYAPAQPFFTPAIEKGQTSLDNALGKVESSLAGAIGLSATI